MKTILFDLDGTLIQTPKIILEAFKLTFEKYFPNVTLDESELSNFLGQTLWQTFGYYTDDQTLVDDMIAYYRQISNEMIEMGLVAYPNAKKTIQYLKKQGCKIGIVTSKMREVATYHLKLTNLFEDIAIVPIMRAGMGMVEGMLNLIPNAKVGHIGIYRNEKTIEPGE